MSSPPDPATSSDTAFALRELNTCWAQAYEALTRGDLDRVTQLLNQADLQVATAGNGDHDDEVEAALRKQAMSTFALLRQAMQSGLTGLRDEIAHSRRGKKALRGYDHAARGAGRRLTHRV